MSNRAKLDEAILWAEAVRLHYMSLEGAGPGAMDEAEFFLIWHHDNCAGLDRLTKKAVRS